MTPDQARIVILEDALIRSYHQLSFLHNCLTDEKFVYDYPEQLFRQLRAISDIIEIPPSCVHSSFERSCESCQESRVAYERLMRAKKELNDD